MYVKFLFAFLWFQACFCTEPQTAAVSKNYNAAQRVAERLAREPQKKGIEPFSPAGFDAEVTDMITGKVPMVDVVKKLVEKGEIPLPSHINPEGVVFKDITTETAGRARQAIILIGVRQQPTDTDTKWLYVFKETRDESELKGIHDAYQMMRSPVIEHNGYKLRFAWHEKLWCFKGATNTGFRSTDRYFELLHAAKGVSLESIVNSFYDFSKYAVNSESVVYDRENQCPINDETSKYHEDFYSLRREAAKGNKSLRYMLCRELIEYFSKKSPVGPEEIKLKEFIDKFNVQETRGYLSHFLLDGTFFYNFEAVPQLIEAYRAFGSVLGKYLKPFQKSSHPVESGKLFETPELDPHANNIFYDASSKTVTWIDLQKTGEDFVKPQKDTYTTIGYANHIIFGCFFYPGCRNQLFKNGLEFFFPDYETNPNLKIKLLEERDKLFNAVRGILEAFVEGFASNWETKEDKKLLREHFKERWHFPYSTPAEFFTNADEPFVFG